MKSKEIVAAITTGQFDNAELNEIIEAVKFARKRLATKTTAKLTAGTRVQWTGKRGFQTGTVRKVNIKNVIVDADDGLGWNIPANMLTAI